MAWHDVTCAALKLEWEDGRPGCLTCLRKAPALSPVHPISPPGPPPDVPRSQLVCTWPPQLFSDDCFVEPHNAGRRFHYASDSEEFSDDDTHSISNHKFAEGDPAHIKDKLFSSPEDKNDRLSLRHSLEHAKDAEHDVGAEDQDAKMLAFISANIDEWTSSDTTHQSQTLSELSRKDVERPHNPPEAHTSFQNIYPSLPNADSVRLLRLHGTANESDPIHCTLLVYRLRDPSRPTFEAFSYTWADLQGDSLLCETIFVGPQYDILPVTKNCLAALRCFRTSADRLVWVDAICINQFDLNERGHQVSLMRDVYKSAARVLTYLGKWSEDFGDITELPHYNDRRSDHPSGTAFADVSKILCLPYFSRIWVIQEVLLGNSATLSVGKHTIHWKDFRDLVQNSLSGQHKKPASALVEHFDSKDGDMSLLSWLKATKDSRSGDLRDRVYGLMGLISEEDRRDLPVDYSISKQELYTGLAMYWLTYNDENGGLIPQVLDMALSTDATSGLPSWAPDWAPQSRKDMSGKPTSVMPWILQLDTQSIEGPSSGLRWPSLPGSIQYIIERRAKVRWTLDKTVWGEQYDDGRSLSWYRFARDAGWKPLTSVEPLPLRGIIALEAFHILSVSMERLDIPDVQGRPLYGLQLFRSARLGRKQQDDPRDDIHLYVSLDWQKGLALRKHADAVYSISNHFRVVCGPLLNDKGSISETSMSLDGLQIGTARNWLLDVFFFGTGAGSAYFDLSQGSEARKGWSDYFPQASAACKVLNLSFGTHTGEDHQSTIIAAMKEIWQDARDSVDEIICPWESQSNSQNYRERSQFRYHVTEKKDTLLTVFIRKARAAKPNTSTSPKELCLYLKRIARDCRDSCKEYAPLQQALSDLGDSACQFDLIQPSFPFRLDLWNFLMPDRIRIDEEKTVCLPMAPLTMSNILYTAWALLQGLKIDSRFTLEQNFNILWIHVLTMEMVARLRGCLQQQLILKALRDKMRNPQKIYLI